MKRTSYVAPHYTVFTSFPPLPPPYLLVFFVPTGKQGLNNVKLLRFL